MVAWISTGDNVDTVGYLTNGCPYGQLTSTAVPDTFQCEWVNNGFLQKANNISEYKYAPRKTITISIPNGGNMAKANDKEFAVVDLDTGNCIETAKTVDEANRLAASAAGRSDHRVVVFRPIALHEPKKDTVKTDIVLKG